MLVVPFMPIGPPFPIELRNLSLRTGLTLRPYQRLPRFLNLRATAISSVFSTDPVPHPSTFAIFPIQTTCLPQRQPLYRLLCLDTVHKLMRAWRVNPNKRRWETERKHEAQGGCLMSLNQPTTRCLCTRRGTPLLYA